MTKVLNQQNIQKKAFKETMQRGSLLFPIQYNYCDTSSPVYDLPLHWHDEIEIIHIISGTYNFFISDHEETLHKDDICIIPGKIIHGDGKHRGSSLFESIVFDINFLRQPSYSPDTFINDILSSNIYLQNVISSENTEILKTLLELFKIINEKQEGYDLIASGYLLIFFGLIKKEKKYTEKNILSLHKRVRAEQIEKVLTLIRQNYGQDLPLELLSDTAGLSPKYFCRLFKDITDHTPIEYLKWFRINRACSLLRETNERLPDIAEKCGFNDFSYFIKIFRRYKGVTPLKYRTLEIK